MVSVAGASATDTPVTEILAADTPATDTTDVRAPSAARQDPVEELLLKLARHAAGTSEPPTLPRDADAMGRLWRRAGEEGLRGFLVERLAEEGQETARSHRAQLDDFAHGARLMGFLERLGDELHRRGLEALVLKGAALVGDLYGGHLARRPMSDIDLLPAPRDLPAVEALLHRLGLRRAAASWRGPGLEVDLHRDLVGVELMRTRALAFRFPPADLFAQARPFRAGLLRLSDAHQALHLAVHVQKHAYGRWIWLLDLALLLPRLEGPEIVRLAEATGSGRSLAAACKALEIAFGMRVPRWYRRLPRLSQLERAYLQAVLSRPQSLHLGGLMVTPSVPGVRGKLRYLRELCWPQERLLRAAQGAGPTGLLRWRRITHKALPGVTQMARVWAARRG